MQPEGEGVSQNGDARGLCGNSLGFKPGVYYLGHYFLCTPSYSYRAGALDHRYCTPGRRDCWEGLFMGKTLKKEVACESTVYPCIAYSKGYTMGMWVKLYETLLIAKAQP